MKLQMTIIYFNLDWTILGQVARRCFWSKMDNHKMEVLNTMNNVCPFGQDHITKLKREANCIKWYFIEKWRQKDLEI